MARGPENKHCVLGVSAPSVRATPLAAFLVAVLLSLPVAILLGLMDLLS